MIEIAYTTLLTNSDKSFRTHNLVATASAISIIDQVEYELTVQKPVVASAKHQHVDDEEIFLIQFVLFH